MPTVHIFGLRTLPFPAVLHGPPLRAVARSFGGLYGLRAAMPVMRRQGHGRIVNTLSRGAEMAAPGWAAYGSVFWNMQEYHLFAS